MRDLVIFGAGGFARETAQAVHAVNAREPTWRLRGHIDDDPAKRGRDVAGVPVLGPSAVLHEMPEAAVVVCVGNPADYFSRARIVRRLGLGPDRYASVIHPSAEISDDSRVGPGSVLLAHVVLTSAVSVGAHVAVMPHVVLTHDVEVGDYATVASGVRFGGGVGVGVGAYVGAGALIRESRTIGAWALVGMGGLVLDDVPPGEVWVGSPARRLRDVEVPEDLTSPNGGVPDPDRAGGGLPRPERETLLLSNEGVPDRATPGGGLPGPEFLL